MRAIQEQPYCLVLGGGGAKGVYHIGVWKALTELNIPVNAFIGNSIGAIVAAYLAQGEGDKLEEIAKTLRFSSVVELHSKDHDKDPEQFKNLSYWQDAYKNLIEHKGLNTSPMRTLLCETLSEEKLRNAGVDFGVTTVNVSDFKAREVFIDKIEKDHIIQYVMASAAFPGFTSPKIKGKKYADGGIYDNLPYKMARRRGYRKIILVDISGIGRQRTPKTEGSQTVYIKNSIDMGSAFDFDPTFLKDFIELGYLDALRSFGELVGYDYFLEPNPNAEQDWGKHAELFKTHYRKYPKSMRHDLRLGLKTLEVCASLLHVPRIKKYSYASLLNCVTKTVDECESLAKQTLNNLKIDGSDGLEGLIKTIIDVDRWDQSAYFYDALLQQAEQNTATTLAKKALYKISPELEILNTLLKVEASIST